MISADAFSGNLSVTISDHLPQCTMISNVLSNAPSNKSNVHGRDWSNFDQVNFVLDNFSIKMITLTLLIKTEHLTEAFLC